MFYRKVFNSSPVGSLYTAGLPVSTALYLQTIASNTTLNIVNTNSEKVFDFNLEQNYPNPFNSSTMFRFKVSTPANINLSVYNVQGELIEKIFEGKLHNGVHKILWTPETNLSSGVYYLRMESNATKETKKVILLK